MCFGPEGAPWDTVCVRGKLIVVVVVVVVAAAAMAATSWIPFWFGNSDGWEPPDASENAKKVCHSLTLCTGAVIGPSIYA